MNIEILYKDKNLIAVKKPIGVAVQPDPSGDLDLMTALARGASALIFGSFIDSTEL